MKYVLATLSLLFLLSGCSFGSDGDSKKIAVNLGGGAREETSLEDSFLWERIGDEAYVMFAAKMRCGQPEGPGFSDEQRALLSEVSLSEEQYTLEGARPDWLEHYAKSGLEQEVQKTASELCSEKLNLS